MTDTDHSGTDYSDFEYQQISATLEAPAADGDQQEQAELTFGVSPLSDVGGLANNEVAELVAYRLSVSFDSDDEAIAGDQNVGGGYYLSGSFGANAADVDAIPEEFDSVELEVGPGNTETSLSSASRDEIFDMFQASASLAFDDQAGGLGGGMHVEGVDYDRNMRQLTGRGPVLDQTDDVTLAARAIASDSVVTGKFKIHVHLIWDVAETSDAGRAFSVPN